MKSIKLHFKQLLCLPILVLLCSFTFIGSTNQIKNKTFRINGIGFENIERTSYELTLYDEKDTFRYGNFITFTDSTFHSYYSAPCGNDCFTDVEGTYSFVSDTAIQIVVKSIVKSGYCRMEEGYTKGDFGTYKLIKNNNTITLKK